uniref:Uncharacterized protein n=1 Tax=Tanacetum cinerariifolium TaxID=118510 RepID=A0A699TJC2_TANCI|nr:hypothetical protein [Tanacetum cinerariifolium]
MKASIIFSEFDTIVGHKDLVLSDVRLVTKRAIRQGTAKTKDFNSQTSLYHPTKSRDEISLRLRDYNNS